MKKILGSIPIVAVFVLLLGLVFNIVPQPDQAEAAIPTIRIDKPNPVPGFIGTSPDVETEWANMGTTVTLTIEDTDLAAAPNNGTTQTVTVEVDAEESEANTGVFTLQESAVDSGEFIVSFNINSTSTSALTGTTQASGQTFDIAVDDDDEVQFIVRPTTAPSIDFVVSRTIGVENDRPDISNVTPEDGEAVDDEDLPISFTVDDGESGIPEPEDATDGDDEYMATVLLFSDDQCPEDSILPSVDADITVDDIINNASGDCDVDVVNLTDEDDFDGVAGGFDVDTSVFRSVGTHFFTVMVFDAAGNFEVFDGGEDGDEALAEVTIDEDEPEIDEARTGILWDDADEEFDDNQRNWIQLIFDEDSDLDPASISADDFVVEGHTVRRVQWFDFDPADDFDAGDFPFLDVDGSTLMVDENSAVPPRAAITKHVYIELEAELDPDEEPQVNVVPDGVSDEAGNSQSNDDVDADDWIGPEFVIESVTTPLTPLLLAGEDMEAEIVFRADEDISGNPTVEVHPVVAPPGCVIDGVILHGGNVANRSDAEAQADWGLDADEADDLADDNGCATGINGVVGSRVSASVSEIGTNRWRATVNEPPGGTAGYFNIYLSGTDRDDRTGDEGLDPDSAASDNVREDFFRNNGDVNTTDARFFEGDTVLPPPTVLIDGQEVEVDEDTFEFRNPFFIEINFERTADGEDVNEDEEYHEDSFSNVVITMFELDGVDLTDLVSTTNNQRFLVAVENIAIGEHEIVIQAVDQAGNAIDDDVEVEFEVEERETFDLQVNPGWNLFSLAGDPADPSINTVFGPGSPVTTVYTFDPTVPGGWLVAVRQTPDDPWVGDLMQITANRGYWALASAIDEVQVDIPRLGGGAVGGGTPAQPPIIDLFPGWNLVPIVDVTGDAEAGDFIDADVYFASVNEEITRILTFNTLSNTWVVVPFFENPTDSDSANTDGDVNTPATLDDEDLEYGKAYWVFGSEQSTLVPGSQ